MVKSNLRTLKFDWIAAFIRLLCIFTIHLNLKPIIRIIFTLSTFVSLTQCKTTEALTCEPIITKSVSANQIAEGYFDFEWDTNAGKIWLYVDKVDEFLYINSLAAGVGSNNIGLDRGQLGGELVVKFQRASNKLLLTYMSYDYRAVSDNAWSENQLQLNYSMLLHEENPRNFCFLS